MGIYSGFKYSAEKYGRPPKFAYSVEPFTAEVIWYDQVRLSWSSPTGNYQAIRLLRNQSNLPETEEDGLIIWQWDSTTGGVKKVQFVDGVDNLLDSNGNNDSAFVSGKSVYYRMWIWTNTNQWIPAGETYTLIPKQHKTSPISQEDTHSKLMGLIPRVFTSSNYSPFGEIDYSSELSTFLKGFSLTLDEMLTYADLIQPNLLDSYGTPTTNYLNSVQLGLTPEIGLTTAHQARLVREAVYIYQRKGTKDALSDLIESLTGFAPVLTDSPNKLLSSEDSSFVGGVGSWLPVNGVTIAVENTIATPSGEAKSIDVNNCAKVTVSSTGGKLINGVIEPVLNGTPVIPGTEYTFSFYTKRNGSSSPTITPKITWYNYLGKELSSTTGSAETLTTSWAKKTTTGFAPGYVGTLITADVTSNVATVTLDRKHPFVIGDSVTIADSLSVFNGTKTITAVTTNTISFAATTTDAVDLPIEGTVRSSTWTYASQAHFASLELTFSAAAGTLYLDLIQLADSSTTVYNEARAISVFLEPQKTNYIKNPSFSSTGTDWTITSASHTHVPSTLTGLYTGSTMLEVVCSTGSPTEIYTDTDVDIEVGKFYSYSMYAKTSTGTETFDFFIDARDASTGDTVVSRLLPITVTSAWTRFHVNLYIPAGSPAVDIRVGITNQSTTGKTVFLEAAQLEKTFSPTDYFDGSLPTDYGTVWAGTENASISYAYPQKMIKMQRVLAEIEKFLPLGTPYTIYSYAGLEGSGIS